MNKGYVNRGRIGVSIAEVDADTGRRLWAWKTNWRTGAWGGEWVTCIESGRGTRRCHRSIRWQSRQQVPDLPRIVGNTKPDATVSMTVIRRGKEQILRIRVGRFEREPVVAEKPKTPEPVSCATAVGLAVVDLTAADKKELEIESRCACDSRLGARHAPV